jgi:hypothetical protein
MSGKNPRMTPLQSRKQLLLAESELNRAQLVRECRTMIDGIHTLVHHAKSFYSVASTAAVLVAGLAALRRRKTAETAPKRSWLQTIFKGAGLISTLWMSLRSRKHDRD